MPNPPVDLNPTLLGYTYWIRTIMGVDSTILLDDSPYILLSYSMADEVVNYYLDIASPLLYTQAVYNLGGDILVNITQDTSPSTYWFDMRTKLNVNSFIPGMINASNDEDTSAAILTPLGLQNITLGDLQSMKTPWGRTYLAIAQSVGTLWGLS